VISHTIKFRLFTTWLEEKYIETIAAMTQDSSIQQKHINKIVEEHQDIPTAPIGVSNQVMINPFILFMLHIHRQIPHTLRKIMQQDWFIKTFNKLTKASFSLRQEAHQGSNLVKSSSGT
jgi:hypothetical protein